MKNKTVILILSVLAVLIYTTAVINFCLGDVLIRIFDLIGTKYGIDDLDFTGNSIKYSSGKTFTEKAAYLARRVLWSNAAMCELVDCIRYVETWSQALGFDIMWHIENKMRYNTMRQNKHGKKY